MTARKPVEWIPTEGDVKDALRASASYDSGRMSFHNWRTLRAAADLWLKEQTRADPLGEALNSGNGSYKP